MHHSSASMVHYIAAFLVAISLFFTPFAAQQFELSKWSLLWLGICGALIYVVTSLQQGSWSFQRVLQKTPWSFWIFIAFIILHSCIISIVPTDSFWGSYQRHTGAVTWIAQLVLFCVIVGRKWSQNEIGHILRSVAVAGTLTAFVGMAQWMMPYLWGDLTSTAGRVFGTIGVPNFFGQLLLLTLCITLLPFFEELHAKRKVAAVWGSMLCVQMLALMLSGNRASLFILVVLAVTGTVVFLWKLALSTDRRVITTVILTGIVGTLIFAIASRSDGFYRSIATRLELYPAAISAIIERPLLGHGLDTVYTVFTPRLPENLGQTENVLDIPDKVHHILLDTLVEIGLVGAMLLCICVYAVIRQGFRSVQKEKGSQRCYAATLMLAVLAWSLSLLVSFPGITERVIAVVLVALLFAESARTEDAVAERPLKTPKSYISTASVVIVALISGLFGASVYAADVLYAQIRSGALQSDLTLLQKITPVNKEYLVFGSNGTIKNILPNERIQYLTQALRQNPQDIWALTFRALAHHDAGEQSAASQDIQSAYTLCPRCPFVTVQGAKIAHDDGDQSAKQAWAEAYFQLLPQFVTEDPNILAQDIQNRRRITIKEQQADIVFMLGMLPETVSNTLREAIFR